MPLSSIGQLKKITVSNIKYLILMWNMCRFLLTLSALGEYSGPANNSAQLENHGNHTKQAGEYIIQLCRNEENIFPFVDSPRPYQPFSLNALEEKV